MITQQITLDNMNVLIKVADSEGNEMQYLSITGQDTSDPDNVSFVFGTDAPQGEEEDSAFPLSQEGLELLGSHYGHFETSMNIEFDENDFVNNAISSAAFLRIIDGQELPEHI